MKFIDKEKIGLHRKPIHVFLLEDTHRDLKKFCKENRVTMQEIVENFVQDMLDYEIDICGCRKLIWNTNSIIIIFIFSTCILISLCILGYILYIYSDS